MATILKVKEGDCVSSLAYQYGLNPDTVREYSENVELHSARKDLNILKPGDLIAIPEKQLKQEMINTNNRHRFRRKGVPEIIQIVFKDELDNPRKYIPCAIDIDGALYYEETDQEGMVRHAIPPNASICRIILQTNTGEEEYAFNLGELDPFDDIKGAQQRLVNLGFIDVPIDGKPGEKTREAIEMFQLRYDIETTGELDEPTALKLKEVHGS